MTLYTFTQTTLPNAAPERAQRLNVDVPKSQYFALKLYALHNETTVSQLVRDSLRNIVEYDAWFKAKVQAAQANPRLAIAPEEWDAIRAQKLAQRKALAAKACFNLATSFLNGSSRLRLAQLIQPNKPALACTARFCCAARAYT